MLGLSLVLAACVDSTRDLTGQAFTPTENVVPVEAVATASETQPRTTFELESGKGAVVGRVKIQGASRENIVVFLAPFYRVRAEGEGFYALEPSVHPHAALQEGSFFELANVDPGSYVMMIGTEPRGAFVVEQHAQPRIWEVPPDEVLDVGEIRYFANRGAFAG